MSDELTPVPADPVGEQSFDIGKDDYYALLGPAPNCGPADHLTALKYLHRIELAIGQGHWTRVQRWKLSKLRQKWSARAFGRDPRFELVGTRTGRLPLEIEQTVINPKRRRIQARINAQSGGRHPNGARLKHPDHPAKSTLDELREFRQMIDADLPSGKAKGGRGLDDDQGDEWDQPEPGEIPLPPAPNPRQYLIPGTDGKGHGHRVYCHVLPAHYRALLALERSRHFGFRSVGDVMRWCIDFGIRELTERGHIPQARSAMAQVDAIREILLDEQYYQEFPALFEQMSATINRHLAAGSTADAARLVALVRHYIEQMGEESWRERYLAELMRQFGHLLGDSANLTESAQAGSAEA